MIIGSLILSFLVDWLFTDEMNAQIGEVVNSFLAYMTKPIEFGFAQAFILYFQGLALVIAVVVIIIRAATGSYKQAGQSMTASQDILRSIWPIAIIAGSPVIFSTVTSLVHHMISDLTAGATSGIDYGSCLKGVLVLTTSGAVGQIISCICAIAVIYYTITICFGCIKRMVQLAVLSIIGPLVCVMTVSDNNSGDVITLVKEMFGIGVIVSLQIALLLTAIALPGSGAFSSAPLLVRPLLICAIFSAVKALPRYIERYALAPAVGAAGGSGARTVGMMAGFAGRSAITSAIRK